MGFVGPDKGKGGKYLFLPPGYEGDVPEGYFIVRSPTYSVAFAIRGFQVDNKTDQAVDLMKQTKIYPLARASSPPPMEFMNGSRQGHQTVFPDNFHFFEMLAKLVEEEPAEVFDPLSRFQMQAIGIEKGKPFNPDERTKALLSEAATIGGAIARANTYASPSKDVFYYPDRKWQTDGRWSQLHVHPRWHSANRCQEQRLLHGGGQHSCHDGEECRGGLAIPLDLSRRGRRFSRWRKSYKLHVLPNIPAEKFWSVVVYDALSRSELQNGQPFPSVSSYTGPKINDDGSVDVFFGPKKPEGAVNWIKTVPGKGWFPIFRFYSPAEAFFDKSWVLNDLEEVN